LANNVDHVSGGEGGTLGHGEGRGGDRRQINGGRAVVTLRDTDRRVLPIGVEGSPARRAEAAAARCDFQRGVRACNRRRRATPRCERTGRGLMGVDMARYRQRRVRRRGADADGAAGSDQKPRC